MISFDYTSSFFSNCIATTTSIVKSKFLLYLLNYPGVTEEEGIVRILSSCLLYMLLQVNFFLTVSLLLLDEVLDKFWAIVGKYLWLESSLDFIPTWSQRNKSIICLSYGCD